ncbi:DUF6779 domain-containing protein [Kibdelosporangium phytohabitans]|uniref:DUF6779 domain-containing protein n=1 Tax=Kibdelosporangium phytohabitans TaxID=860235 RepID=A0A0N9HVD9_9PSEU|nr:DUF6779 domain-containing protein [Kibdelosporangium phytohabitans]ALG05890.1 hypothetical protein AOZ06_02220 [Kibdelosporangium phytohabitans]MBE1466067.1 hypothetical protein [Kibdelosporangium phytohabitans]
MSGRASSTRDSIRVPSTARILLGGALVLVLGATLILVLTDDARFLKMGILAALWAALVGAFLAARFRRQVADKTDDAQSMQAIYELELEREIAARREYELELEADAKRKAEEQSRADIDALRTELGQLRETLQTLLGGEVLVERFALQAQATRMRSLPDESHQLPQSAQVVKRLSPAASQQPVVISEPQTELIERVVERPRSNAGHGGGSARPQPQRPQQQRPPREPAERQVQIRQPRRDDPADPGSGWWDPVTPVGRQDNAYHRPVAGDSANSLGEGIDPNWTPSWERDTPPPVAAAQPRQQAGRPPRPPKKPEPQVSRPMQRPDAEAPAAQDSRPMPRPDAEAATRVQPQPSMSQRLDPDAQVNRPAQRQEPEAPTRIQPLPEPTVVSKPAARATPEPPPPPPPVRKPEPSTRVVAPPAAPVEEAGGRRRAPEPTAAAAAEAAGGGRRRRAEDAPSWQETYQARQQQSGSHTQPAVEADPEPGGSHAAGKSVNELLAAYGSGGDAPRRRRRRAD